MEHRPTPTHRIGDDAAFEELVRRATPRLERHLRGAAEAGIDVESILQETYLKALRHWSIVTGLTPDGQLAWLGKTAGRLVVDEMRKGEWRHRDSRLAADAYDDPRLTWHGKGDAADPAARVEARERLRRVCALIPQLTPREQDVVIMHCLLGYDYEDTARYLCTNSGAVATAMSRARGQLRSLKLSASGEEDRA